LVEIREFKTPLNPTIKLLLRRIIPDHLQEAKIMCPYDNIVNMVFIEISIGEKSAGTPEASIGRQRIGA